MMRSGALALLLAFAAWAQHEPARPAESPAAEGAREAKAEEHEPSIWWKWANFAILVAGLGYVIGKNAGPFFRARTDEIRKGIEEAVEMRRQAEARAAEIEARLSRLDQEIGELRAHAKSEIATEGERVRAETEHHLEKIRAAAEQEIASATKAARLDLKAYSADLALGLAEQKIRNRLTPEVQAGLLASFVHGLGEGKVR